MITYDYECPRCGRAFTAEQRITDAPLTECPLPALSSTATSTAVFCGGPARRVISGSTTFVLKGKGWAKDGY